MIPGEVPAALLREAEELAGQAMEAADKRYFAELGVPLALAVNSADALARSQLKSTYYRCKAARNA